MLPALMSRRSPVEAKYRAQFASGERARAESGTCNICKFEKPAKEFYVSNTNKNGLHSWCKDCSDRRTVENGRKRWYRITPEQYESMMLVQRSVCAICGKSSKRSLSVDHDHKTGKVRALLCSKCNTLLGVADESSFILGSAILYLKTYSNEDKC